MLKCTVGVVLAVVGGLTLTGCEYLIGKVYLDKTRAQVYLTENAQDIKDCEFIKSVSSKTYWGGLLLQSEAQERVISNLTHDASNAGANVLLIKDKAKSMMGSKAVGEAYRCKEVVFSSPVKLIESQDPASSTETEPAGIGNPTASEDEVVEKLKRLKRLKDEGILTEREYLEKRKALVDQL